MDCSLCRQSVQCHNPLASIVVFAIVFSCKIMNEADRRSSHNLLQHRILFDIYHYQVGFSIECLLQHVGDLLHLQGDPVHSAA